MEIPFLKMQGCGDDTVVMDTARLPIEAHALLPQLARRILDRSFGVGGNTLLILGTPVDAVLSVRSFDPEGEEAGLSFHALRCAARYASDSGTVSASSFTMAVGTQKLRVQIIDSQNVRIDMGQPLGPDMQAEIRENTRDTFTKSMLVEGRTVSYTPISIVTPYAMLFVPDFSFPVRRTARRIAQQPDFPEGTGIGFVQVISREVIRLRIWEPADDGPGDQCACAAAALVASVVNGFTEREVFVHLKGGDVFLQWEETDNRIWVTGPAAYVFTGTFDFPDAEKEQA